MEKPRTLEAKMNVNFKVEVSLHDKFLEIVNQQDLSLSQTMREFIKKHGDQASA